MLNRVILMKMKNWKVIVESSNLATKFDFKNRIFLKKIKTILKNKN